MAVQKRFVYVLTDEHGRSYVGVTSNVEQRVETHNRGASAHTARYRPWGLAVAIELRSEELALRFERYLKSGSGRAFARRHFL